MATLKKGCSAYFDSFSGLVPVTVLSVCAPETMPSFDLGHGNARMSIKVRAKVTEDFNAYKKGEILDSDSLSIVPKGALRRREFSMVVGVYDVIPDLPTKPAAVRQQPMS